MDAQNNVHMLSERSAQSVVIAEHKHMHGGHDNADDLIPNILIILPAPVLRQTTHTDTLRSDTTTYCARGGCTEPPPPPLLVVAQREIESSPHEHTNTTDKVPDKIQHTDVQRSACAYNIVSSVVEREVRRPFRSNLHTVC